MTLWQTVHTDTTRSDRKQPPNTCHKFSQLLEKHTRCFTV